MKHLLRRLFFWDAPTLGTVDIIANKGAIDGH